MKLDSLSDLLALALPLLAIGFLAGAVRAAALRAREPKARRLLVFAWIALLLVGPPLWLFFGVTLGLF